MHFKKVTNTINRPHFLAERNGEEILLNFSHDHKSLRSRSLAEPSSSSLQFAERDAYAGLFLYGDVDAYLGNRQSRQNKIEDMELTVYSKHGLGAWDGKVYFFDDSSRTEKMKVWRVDSRNGVNEYTTIASGFTTRFLDSEYFIVNRARQSTSAAIYEWKTSEDAKMIKKIRFPPNLADYTRIAYGSKILFVKTDNKKITIVTMDAITEVIKNKVINVQFEIDEKKMRWFCAKNYLMAVISGQFMLVQIDSLSYEMLDTNLEENGKYHVFAVDFNGFVYVLNPTAAGCSVMRARDIGLSTIRDTPIVIPVKEDVREPKKEKKNTVEINFHVTYKGETLLQQKMKMLNTNRIGDVIRRSPEIHLPPNTRLRTFYKNDEVLTFRTPNFLRMKDGDSILAEFTDNDATSYDHRKEQPNTQSGQTTQGFFSRDMLNELGYSGAPTVHKIDQVDERNEIERAMDRRQTQKETRQKLDKKAQRRGATPPTDSTIFNVLPRSDVVTVSNSSSNDKLDEKILREMQWLRSYLEKNVGNNGDGNETQRELDHIKKKYARALMMMGRSQLKK